MARELPLVWKGKTLISGIDPVRRAERVADSVPIYDRTLYLCPSPLYGYGLTRLLDRLEGAAGSALLCIEAEGELYDLAEKIIGQSFSNNKKFLFTRECDPAALYALAKKTWGRFRRVETVRLSGGWLLYSELYNSIAGSLRKEIAGDWGNTLTLAALGRKYIRNLMRNLCLIPHCPNIDSLSFGSSPVLVLGAGPSLDTLLDGLARRFGTRGGRPFKIICADTCLPVLKERNIAPDLAVILESQHWNMGDFIGCRGWDIPAAVDLSALPLSAQMLGKAYLFATEWTDLLIFDRLKKANLFPPVIPPLGSVGITAVEIARRITYGNIITAGIDFSFTADKYHARSSAANKNKFNRQNRFLSLLNADAAFSPHAAEAVSNSGAAVRTNPVMRNYRDLFEREFSSDQRLYCVLGSGLPLGIKTLDQDEAFGMLETPPVNGKAGRTENDSAAQNETIENLTNFLAGERERLTSLRNILSQGEGKERLASLIKECNYLWAHFPDYSGTEIGEAALESLSFLKRIRAEIDPMLALTDRALLTLKKAEN